MRRRPGSAPDPRQVVQQRRDRHRREDRSGDHHLRAQHLRTTPRIADARGRQERDRARPGAEAGRRVSAAAGAAPARPAARTAPGSRTGTPSSFDGGVGTAGARLEDLRQAAVQPQAADDLRPASGCRPGGGGHEVPPQRRGDASRSGPAPDAGEHPAEQPCRAAPPARWLMKISRCSTHQAQGSMPSRCCVPSAMPTAPRLSTTMPASSAVRRTVPRSLQFGDQFDFHAGAQRQLRHAEGAARMRADLRPEDLDQQRSSRWSPGGVR